jgi:hypothetical protein
MEPLKLSNINLDNIIYTKIKKNQDYKIILMKYNNNSQLRINTQGLDNFVFQTPKILNLNSVCNYENELLLSLNENVKGLNEFSDFIKKLEEKIKNDVSKNSSWLYNDEYIILQKLIRDNNCIKIKLFNNSDFKTLLKLNNKDNNNINIDNSCYCKLILECYGIWINSKNNFGIYLRPIIVSFIQDNNLYNYNFVSDSETSNISNQDLNIVDSFDNNKESEKESQSEVENNHLFINNNSLVNFNEMLLSQSNTSSEKN